MKDQLKRFLFQYPRTKKERVIFCFGMCVVILGPMSFIGDHGFFALERWYLIVLAVAFYSGVIVLTYVLTLPFFDSLRNRIEARRASKQIKRV